MGNECSTTLVPLKSPAVLYGKMVVWKSGNGSSPSSVVYKPRYCIKMVVISGGFI